MATTLAQIDIINQALARIGVKPIADLAAQDDVTAEQCRIAWPQDFPAVARAHPWSCLTQPAVLQQVAQAPIIPADPVPASTPWAPGVNYAAGDYVTFGDPAYLYQALIANFSTASFTNDLTSGFWFQTDTFNGDPFGDGSGSAYPSGWQYQYNLPADFLLLVSLNRQPYNPKEKEAQIMGLSLYTNQSQAVIKYVWNDPDTTHYDALLIEALKFKLCASLATILRQDDANIATSMEMKYRKALAEARIKDAGETRGKRFDPVANSRWVGSRISSTNR